MNLNKLFDSIGTIDAELDCLYPVYLLYPEIPRYRIIYDEKYFMPLVKKHFEETKDIEAGDLLLFLIFNSFHFGIYAGDNKFFHCCKNHKLRISRFSGYKGFLKGVYKFIKN